MKHTQEVSKSDLQGVKILFGDFLGMFHIWQLRIKLLKLPIFTMAVNVDSRPIFTMIYSFWINTDFVNRPQFDPLDCQMGRNNFKLQGKGSNWDLFSNQDLFQKSLLSLTLENHKHPIDFHCKKFNSLILSCNKWNISKKCLSQIFTACRSGLDTSWKCFMCDNSELSCWNFYNGSQWSVNDFTMLKDGRLFGINTDLRINRNWIRLENLNWKLRRPTKSNALISVVSMFPCVFSVTDCVVAWFTQNHENYWQILDLHKKDG